MVLRNIFFLAFAFALFVQGYPLAAGEAPPRPDVESADIDVQADSLEYLRDTGMMIGKGNVVVQRYGDTLSADYVKVDTETLDAHARGNVVLLRDDWEWTGEELNYNFKTKEGDFGTFEATSGKFYLKAEESKRLESGNYEMKDVIITTCDEDDMEFKVHATHAVLTPEDKVKAYNVTPYLGPVPFFYLPYMWIDLDREHSNWEVSLGHSGDWGPFVLLGYRHKFNDSVESLTHLDFYAKRGVGVGEDIFWERTDDSGRGRLETYYLNDQDPLPSEYDKERFGDLVDSDRYRVRLVDTESLSDRDSLIADLQYVSDPKVREEFFEDDFRRLSQPENRVDLTRRGDNYSANALLNVRLNDFYENIDRKPELSLDFNRQKIGDSDFYYQGENSFVRLEKLYPDFTDQAGYETTRIDSRQTIYYPRKYFGFLNLIPSAGGRATYYSDLVPRTLERTNTVTMTDSNGVEYTTNQVETTTFERGSDTRTMVELGLESSFKAFKVLTERNTAFGRGIRHVLEPHAKYSFRSDPSVKYDELYQFDYIDSIREQNEIQFGARNKLQTRRGESLVDLVDFDLYTSLRLDPDPDQNDMGPLRFDGEFEPTALTWLDLDGAYDWDESELTDFNARARLLGEGATRLYLNYGYRDGGKNLLAADLDYDLTTDWGVGLYARYDMDESVMEESRYSIQHDMDCIGWEAGVRSTRGRGGEEDDNELWFRLWLLAFPQTDIKFFDASY